jgi:hypothetical protein
MKLLQSVVPICILLEHTTNMSHKYVTLSTRSQCGSKCVHGTGRVSTLASAEKLKCPQASHRGHERVKNSVNDTHNNSRKATKVLMAL